MHYAIDKVNALLYIEIASCIMQSKGGEYMIAINKIKGRLAEKSLTQGDVAKAWKCAAPTVSQKLNGKRPMNLDEAEMLGKLLELDDKEYYEFFLSS